MSRFVHAVLYLGLLPAAASAQAFPDAPPPPADIAPAAFPPVQEARLENGLRIAVVERDAVPIVSLSLTFPAGPAYDAPGKEGTAQLLTDLITKGTRQHTAEEIAERIENVGGQIGVGLDSDFLTLFVTVQPQHAALALATLAEISREATFPESEVALTRSRLVDGLALAKTQPRAVGDRFLSRSLYGVDHPYGRTATDASATGLQREDVVELRDRQLRPEHALLVVTGAMDPRQVEALARQHLAGNWDRPAVALAGRPQAVPISVGPADEILLVHRPGSSQSLVLAGNLAPPAGSPDEPALQVANSVLGGGPQSRLFRVLREEKGWTYGAYSGFETPLGPGLFAAGAEVRTEVTDSALVELLAQIAAMRAETVPAAELDRARTGITGAFPLSVQTVGQLNAQVRTILAREQPIARLNDYRTRVSAVSAGQVREAAASYMRPDEGAVVVVGDASEILGPLQKLRPVRVVDVEGRPLDAGKLAGGAEALPVDASRLTAFSDTFEVRVQGNAMGAKRISAQREDGRWVVEDDDELGGMVRQLTRVTLGPDLTLEQATQEGVIQGIAIGMQVDVADGRATGWSAVPTPQGADSADIDVAVVAGLVETSALPLLFQGLPLTEGASWTIPVLDAAERAVRSYTVTVAGTGVAATPEGSVETWRVQLQGGAQAVVYHVTRSGTPRVVKIEVQGAPVEFVLAGTPAS